MFRFTIRDLLWLTVVVALAVALWLDHRFHRGLAAENDALKDELAVLKSEKAEWSSWPSYPPAIERLHSLGTAPDPADDKGTKP